MTKAKTRDERREEHPYPRLPDECRHRSSSDWQIEATGKYPWLRCTRCGKKWKLSEEERRMFECEIGVNVIEEGES